MKGEKRTARGKRRYVSGNDDGLKTRKVTCIWYVHDACEIEALISFSLFVRVI